MVTIINKSGKDTVHNPLREKKKLVHEYTVESR